MEPKSAANYAPRLKQMATTSSVCNLERAQEAEIQSSDDTLSKRLTNSLPALLCATLTVINVHLSETDFCV